NPWTDLYDREAHDIYCPLSVGRVNEQGEVEPPRIVELLTIDTEKGELPEDTALEVSAHIRRALKDFPDEPGLLTWVYPFDELHDDAAEDPASAGRAFFHDWFVRNAINEGLPLNTVISSKAFAELAASGSKALDETILVLSTTWLKGEAADRVAAWVERGGKVLLYGPVWNERIAALLNVASAGGMEGECELFIASAVDSIKGTDAQRMKLNHRSELSGGGIAEVVADAADPNTRVYASVKQGEEERVFAASRSLPE